MGMILGLLTAGCTGGPSPGGINQSQRPSCVDPAQTTDPCARATGTCARWVWGRRVFNEAGSVQIATRLREAACASGLTDPTVAAALARLEEDERLHQELASDYMRAEVERLKFGLPIEPPTTPAVPGKPDGV